ncbi:CDP-glycerol glycerophosphotransferase family protein [bacterium]
MKILIFIEGDLYYRNFIKSGAFDKIIKSHQVSTAYVKNPEAQKYNVTSKIEREGLQSIRSFPYPVKRANLIYNFTVLNMVKLRKKCSTFMTRYKYQLSKKKRLVYNIISKQPFYWFFKLIFMKYLGIYEPIYNIINSDKPDLVIIPTSLIDSIAIDVILCSRKLRVKTMMLISGWDNISSKGTIPYMPDYLGVWGEQSKKHAVEIHDIPKERIVTLGAAQFQHFYKKYNFDKNELRDLNNIPKDKKLILFAGSARVFDETGILLELEDALNNSKLDNVHILYRPHPWRHRRQYEDSFFKYDFNHITLDVSLAEMYRKHKSDSAFKNLPSTILPDLEYYPKLYTSIDGVICNLTTVMVEAAIFGVPVLAIAFSDGKHILTMDKLVNDAHFQDILDKDGIIVCREQNRLIDSCGKLLELCEMQNIKDSLKESVGYILYNDEKIYGERLADFISRTVK